MVSSALLVRHIACMGLLQKVDPIFVVRSEQQYTAMNSKGVEVDILRREVEESNLCSRCLLGAEDDFWITQARNTSVLLSFTLFRFLSFLPQEAWCGRMRFLLSYFVSSNGGWCYSLIEIP